MSKEDKKTKFKNGRVVTDPRFAAVNHDPRFRKFAAHQGKVQVDERFAGMFQDAAFTMPSRTDKRGGRGPGRKAAEDLKRYYRLAEAQREEEAMAAGEELSVRGRKLGVGEAGEEAGEKPPQASEDAGIAGARNENASFSSEDEQERERRARWSRLRGIGAEEESSSEEEEEAGGEKAPDSDAEDASLRAEWGVGALAVNPRERIPGTEQATARLAAVDLDWDHVRAVDILAVLRSFAGGNQGVRRVTVYPSDYGLERLAEEAVMGPPTSIYRSAGEEKSGGGENNGSEKGSGSENGSGSEEGSGSEDENDIEFGSDGEAGGEEEKAAKSGEDSEEDRPASLPPPNSLSANHKGIGRSGDGEIDDERLRVYERSRLRYYYAVVECASAEVASKIYDECDGMEFLLSACKFDLRFVPEEQSFEGRQVRDAAASVPPDYVPPFFEARALQLTNVGLSWDGEDKSRRKILTRKMTAEDIKEDDLRAYLASSSDSDAETEKPAAPSASNGRADRSKAERDLYRSLLVGGGDPRESRKDWGKAQSEEESEAEPEEEAPLQRNKDMEMVVTFGGGLDQLGQRLLEKKNRRQSKQEETVWDAYLQRRREKRAAAKKLGKHNIYSDDESDGDGGFGGSGSEDDAPHGTKDDPFFQHDADPFADPFFADGTAEAGQKAAAKKRAGGKEGGKVGRVGKDGKGPKAPSRDADELDLLALGDDAILSGRGGPAPPARSGDKEDQAGKRLSRKERIKAKKALKRREREFGSDDEGEQGGQQPAKPLDDSRFADLVDSPAFALDPTDPRYDTRTAALASEITARKVKRGRDRQEPTSKPREDVELRMMVAAVKRKSAAKRE